MAGWRRDGTLCRSDGSGTRSVAFELTLDGARWFQLVAGTLIEPTKVIPRWNDKEGDETYIYHRTTLGSRCCEMNQTHLFTF